MAETSLVPNEDVTTEWDVTPSGDHFATIDEGWVGSDTADYVDTVTFDAVEVFGFTNPSDVGMVSDLTFKIRVKIAHTAETAVVKTEYSTDGGGSYALVGYMAPAYDAITYYTFDPISGLRLGSRAINRLRVRFTFLEVES